jgi:hypothetical protein
MDSSIFNCQCKDETNMALSFKFVTPFDPQVSGTINSIHDGRDTVQTFKIRGSFLSLAPTMFATFSVSTLKPFT